MTIPTRPAPPPPIYSTSGTSQQRLNESVNVEKLLIKLPPPSHKTVSQQTTTHSITRHFPKAKVNTETPDTFMVPSNRRGPAPPRPPPPKTAPSVLKKPNAPPTSINIVSNLFGKKKSKPTIAVKPDVKQLKPNYLSSHVNPLFTITKAPSPASDLELIQFDTPSPSSPTFTQKSNSDCVSVDSFSSDSNFSSPNNGHGSQTESGFEDDFTTSRATTSPADPWDVLEEVFAKENTPSSSISAPIRNYDILSSRILPEDTLCNGKDLTLPTPAFTMPTIIKPKISQKPKAPNPPALKHNMHSYSSDDIDPPMPSFAPPLPPVTALQGNEFEEPYGIALYDFQSNQEGDLPFTENEKVYLINKINEEWLYGRNKRGCEGMFPSSYIEIRVPLNETDIACSEKQASATSAPLGEKIRALYTFIGQEEGDLTFYENDVITVLSRINEDWLYGKTNMQSGQFPSNYLEYQPKSF